MNKLKIIFIVIILLTIGLFWFNSSMPIPVSYQQSEVAKEIVEQVTDNTKIPFLKFIEKHVRKSAHALEYSILGLVLSLFVLLCLKKITLQYLWNIFSVSLTVAVADEAIQILSGRGPLISDVLIDIFSALIGMTVVFIVYGIVNLIKMVIKK